MEIIITCVSCGQPFDKDGDIHPEAKPGLKVYCITCGTEAFKITVA